MTWWRRWLKTLASRISGPSETEERSTRSKEERARFWGEFRAGQREADERGRAAATTPPQQPQTVTK
ncbi:MAG: hypothetical protein ABIR79_24570 [Candidatus Binatia bacterium]